MQSEDCERSSRPFLDASQIIGNASADLSLNTMCVIFMFFMHASQIIGNAGADLSLNTAAVTPAHFEVVNVTWGYTRVEANGTHFSMEVGGVSLL